MKKISIVFVLCLLLGFKSEAQTIFGPVGAEWNFVGYEKWYDYWAGSTYPDKTWNDHVVSIGDTTIAGQGCRILEITRRLKYGGNATIHTGDPAYEYVYDNADTTFYYNKDSLRFYPLYVWNVQQGDTVCLPHLNHIKHAFCVVIDSVVNVLYGNAYLKTYYTSSYEDTASYAILNWDGWLYQGGGEVGTRKSNGAYIEKLGGRGGFFPNFQSLIADGASEILTPAGSIVCYKDSTIDIHRSNGASCDSVPKPYYTSIANISKAKIQVAIFPNPATNQVNMQSSVAFEPDSWLEVSDVLGRRMIPVIPLKRKEQVSFDVADWSNGIYLMKFKIGSAVYFEKIEVRH
jgi:hypothetical protein